jgi:hypothetical protein
MRVLSLGRLFGAHMVHNTLATSCKCSEGNDIRLERNQRPAPPIRPSTIPSK